MFLCRNSQSEWRKSPHVLTQTNLSNQRPQGLSPLRRSWRRTSTFPLVNSTTRKPQPRSQKSESLLRSKVSIVTLTYATVMLTISATKTTLIQKKNLAIPPPRGKTMILLSNREIITPHLNGETMMPNPKREIISPDLKREIPRPNWTPKISSHIWKGAIQKSLPGRQPAASKMKPQLRTLLQSRLILLRAQRRRLNRTL